MKSNDDTLLCETCGYVIEGLPATGKCPECGREIASSLPRERTGSRWQNKPGLRAWLATVWQVLTRPGELFGRVRVERGGWAPLTTNLLLSAVLLVLSIEHLRVLRQVLGRIGDLRQQNLREVVANTLAEDIGAVALIIAGMAALTVIEYFGIRLVARRRGWRLSKAAAFQVCAHASAGWVFCAVFRWGLELSVGSLLARIPSAVVDPLAYFAPRAAEFALEVMRSGLLAGSFAGMMVFETLVYIGMRRCKFANREKPAPTVQTA